MSEFGQLPLHAEIQQQGARAGNALLPVRGREALVLFTEQPRLGVVQVGRRDDEVAVKKLDVAVVVDVLDARCGVALNHDAADGCAGHDLHALCPREVGDALDHAVETADRIQHAVREVEVTHEVVHAGRDVRGGAEEHRRVAEDLAQPVILHRVCHPRGERLGQQTHERAEAGQHIGGHDRPEVGEGRVQEFALSPARRSRRQSRGSGRASRPRPARSLSNSCEVLLT